MEADIVIAGTGVGGLFSALNLPGDKRIIMMTKADAISSDSFLAQGGICVLRDENDYDSYFEDTMRAGHYENRKESVDIMLRQSREIINDLIGYGVEFEKKNGEYVYTREGAHSNPRIMYHKDITGKEITSKLLERVRELKNVTIMEYTTMTDIMVENIMCVGGGGVEAVTKEENEDGATEDIPIKIYADDVIMATGGIGGMYKHSTNYPHLTGDALNIAQKHGIELENIFKTAGKKISYI